MIGGARDAAQSFLDLSDALESGHIPFTDIPLALGGVTLTDEQGNLAPDYHSPSEWRELQEGGAVTEPQFPTVREPRTATGSAIRGINGFVRRF